MREREKALVEIAAAYQACMKTLPTGPSQGGPFNDVAGIARGHCPRCNACPGYEMPETGHAMNLLALCLHCGCDAKEHEQMRTDADRKVEKDDDIMRNHVWS